jgi:hypothetical protein
MSDESVLTEEEAALVLLLRLRVFDRQQPYRFGDQELLAVYRASNESLDLASLQLLRSRAAEAAGIVDFEEEGAVRKYSQETANLTALIRTYQQSLGDASNDVVTGSRTAVVGKPVNLRERACGPGDAYALRRGTRRA